MEDEEEECKIPAEDLDKLPENIRNILQNHDIAKPSVLIFLYLKLPKPILYFIERKLGLPEIDSESGKPLYDLIKIMKTNETIKNERIKTNERILRPYWDKIENEDRTRRLKKKRYRDNYELNRDQNNMNNRTVKYTVLEKYNVARSLGDQSIKDVAQKYQINETTVKNWANSINHYKYILDLNPLFGNYNAISQPLIKNNEIGKFQEEHGMKATIKKFDISENKAGHIRHWYQSLQEGKLYRSSDNKRLAKKKTKMKNELKAENWLKNDVIEDNLCEGENNIVLPQSICVGDNEMQTKVKKEENGYTSTTAKGEIYDNLCKIESIKLADIIKEEESKNQEKEDWVVTSKRIIKTKDSEKESALKTKYETLEKVFGIIILKERFGFTSKEISRVWYALTSHTVEANYRTYLKSGYNELIRTKINTLVMNHPLRYNPEQVAKARPYIEEFIQKTLTKDKIMPQLNDIATFLKTVPGFEGIGKRYTTKILKNIGYSYKKIKVNAADKTKVSVVRQKEIYLKEYFQNHRLLRAGEGRAEVYVDESFVIDRHFRRYCWIKGGTNTRKYNNINDINTDMNIKIDTKIDTNTYTNYTNTNRPTPTEYIEPQHSMDILNYNKYHQICIVAAISINGWTGVDYPMIEAKLKESEKNGIYKYGSIMYFKAQNVEQKDAHMNFNKALFGEYFRDQLIPSLDRDVETSNGALIIMDQCAYHTPLKEGSFNPRKASRSELMEWLLERGISTEYKCNIQVLRKQVEENGGMPSNYLEDILDKYYSGESKHKILFLPPYHPEFNPIEICWGLLKYTINRNYVVLDPERICREDLPMRFGRIKGDMVKKLYRRLEEVVLTEEGLKVYGTLNSWNDNRHINDKQATKLARKWGLD